jgi:phospholipid/cholesterol/gamma-HCH transport system permease protein
VRLLGTWTLAALLPRRGELEAELRRRARGRPAWDASGVDSLDATGAALLWNAWGRQRPERLNLRPEQDELLASFTGSDDAGSRAPRWSAGDGVAALGRGVLGLGDHGRALVALSGQLLLDAATLLKEPGRAPLRELSATVYRAGATALPVTAMVGFLIGVVVSYLSAQQLRTYGANVLIVNLLGISILRELGPLLAAILVAGRSGSAMTAQIVVMHVTQELDALAALGIPATLRLVLPRVLALTITLPLLVVWTDVIALLGGILASDLELGIGFSHFATRMPDVVPAVNLWIGVGKGAVFGAVIAVVACHYGLRVEPNTESLGANTTSSVVTGITLVLVVDAVFAIALSGVGLGGMQ